MEAHLHEWLNLSIRWVHMITGVAWIGASFYFVWLENHLNRSNPRDGLSGDLWRFTAVVSTTWRNTSSHPENAREPALVQMGSLLHLDVRYRLAVRGVLLEPEPVPAGPGSTLSGAEGVAIGIGSLVAGWFIYDFLCDSPLGKHPALLGAVLFVLIIAACFGFSLVFSGRGAYLHTGAIIGTIMVGNVFRIIMPAQRQLVAAIENNQTPDPVLPAKGLLRSRHNNYFTLPVLFIMISNHFPSTYGSQYNWLILAGIAVAAVLIRHYFNTRHDSNKYAWTLPVGALAMICLAYVTGPKPMAVSPEQAAAKVEYQPLPATAVGARPPPNCALKKPPGPPKRQLHPPRPRPRQRLRPPVATSRRSIKSSRNAAACATRRNRPAHCSVQHRPA